MNWRKVIGWLLVGLGIPFLLIASTISNEVTGSHIPGAFIGALVIGSGWILSHPKKRD